MANDKPIINVKPRLFQTVQNGQKYIIEQGTNLLYILNLRGTPYEMGKAYGQLMAQAIRENTANMLQYLE